MRINMNVLAKEVAMCEGKKQQVNIAQIKEVLKCTFEILASDYLMSECCELIERHE